MVLLQHKLHLKVSQRQILTPGLVQMVSVLALNKLELKDMINAEMVENPVLEELENSVPLIDDVSRREEERERIAAEEAPPAEKKDSFEEIDFGSFFKDYLDPGFRSPGDFEEIERPSFENFLSKPSTLTDHLMWQLGEISTRPAVREAAELIIGNLNEDGYLIASDEELLGIVAPVSPEADAAKAERLLQEATALGLQAVAADKDEIGAGSVNADTVTDLAESPEEIPAADLTSNTEGRAVPFQPLCHEWEFWRIRKRVGRGGAESARDACGRSSTDRQTHVSTEFHQRRFAGSHCRGSATRPARRCLPYSSGMPVVPVAISPDATRKKRQRDGPGA